MKQILCLSNEPWSSSPGRTQQLVSRLRDAQILYFSPPAGRRDIGYRLKGRKVRPNITTYTLPPILFPAEESYPWLFRAQHRKIGRFIAAKAGRRSASSLLWTTHPEQVHLLDHLDYDSLVYDCDRAWEKLPPLWEGKLASSADVVFAASPQLADRLSPCSNNIAILPNGANYPLFSQSGTPARPEDRRPVLGWAGTIWPDLDLSPLLYAAQDRPDWSFLLVGRQEDNPLLPHLRRLPNVKLAGPCSLDRLPDWLSRCDVLLNFLRLGRPYDDVIPSRLFEYLSTGKPVVSMLWPDQVEQFPDVVYGAHDAESFLTLCVHALAELPGLFSQRRRRHGEEAAWSLRAGEISRILSTAGLL